MISKGRGGVFVSLGVLFLVAILIVAFSFSVVFPHPTRPKNAQTERQIPPPGGTAGAPSITSISGSPNPAYIGELVHFNANVYWDGSGGTVTWYVNNQQISGSSYRFPTPGTAADGTLYYVVAIAQNYYGSCKAFFSEAVNPPLSYYQSAYASPSLSNGMTSVSSDWSIYYNTPPSSFTPKALYSTILQVPVQATGTLTNHTSGLSYTITGVDIFASVFGQNNTGLGYLGFDVYLLTSSGFGILLPLYAGELGTGALDYAHWMQDMYLTATEDGMIGAFYDPPTNIQVAIAYTTVNTNGWGPITGWWVYFNYSFPNGATSLPIACLGNPSSAEPIQIWTQAWSGLWEAGKYGLYYNGYVLPNLEPVKGMFNYQPFSISGFTLGKTVHTFSSGGVTQQAMVGYAVQESAYGIFRTDVPQFGVQASMTFGDMYGQYPAQNLYYESSNSVPVISMTQLGYSGIPSNAFGSGETYISTSGQALYYVVAFGEESTFAQMTTWPWQGLPSYFSSLTQSANTDLPNLNTVLLD